MIDWHNTLSYAVKAIKSSPVPSNGWSFGGGTSLMLKFNHRISKDIDIFMDNPQYLNYFLPSLNDYLDSISSDYSNSATFIKISLDDSEIDFIAAPNITGIKPSILIIDGNNINVDDPFEVMAKKIHYRNASFTVRDCIDLAMVYQHGQDEFVNIISYLDDNTLNTLAERIDILSKSDAALMQMTNISKLPGSELINGREFSLCVEFANAINPDNRVTP